MVEAQSHLGGGGIGLREPIERWLALRRGWWLAMAIAWLLLIGVDGVYSAVTEACDARTPGEVIATIGQALYSSLGFATIGALAGRHGGWRIAEVWAVVALGTAALAPVVWRDAGWLAEVVAVLAAAPVIAFVLWLVRRAAA